MAVYGCKAIYNEYEDISEIDGNSPAALSRFNFVKDYTVSKENVEESNGEEDVFQETDVLGLRRKVTYTFFSTHIWYILYIFLVINISYSCYLRKLEYFLISFIINRNTKTINAQ